MTHFSVWCSKMFNFKDSFSLRSETIASRGVNELGQSRPCEKCQLGRLMGFEVKAQAHPRPYHLWTILSLAQHRFFLLLISAQIFFTLAKDFCSVKDIQEGEGATVSWGNASRKPFAPLVCLNSKDSVYSPLALHSFLTLHISHQWAINRAYDLGSESKDW